MADSIQFTGANTAEIEAFTGGQVKADAMDGTVLISADKLNRHKLTPGDFISKKPDGGDFITTFAIVSKDEFSAFHQ